MTGRAAVEAANPATGEVLERLDQQPPEALAEALDAVNARKAELKRWGDALEGELRRRLRLRQTKLAVFGEWEVQVAAVRESSWDAAELEGAMDRLIGEGVLQARDVTDVVTREPVVSRSRANDLARRLDGPARDAILAACTWKEKPAKLTVARSVNLLDAAPGAAEETPSTARPGAAAGSPEPSAGADRAPSGDGTTTAVPSTPAGPVQPAPLDPEELFA